MLHQPSTLLFFLYQLQEIIHCELVPQFDDVVIAANNLRNLISKEAKQIGMVSLLSMDCRTLDGYEYVA